MGASKIVYLNGEMTIEEITTEVVSRIQQDFYLIPKRQVMNDQTKHEFCEYVIAFMSAYTKTSIHTIRSKNKTFAVAMVRYFIYYIINKHFKGIISYNVIGRYCKRDHASVTHGVKTLSNLCDTDPELKKKVDKMEKAFLNYYSNLPKE